MELRSEEKIRKEKRRGEEMTQPTKREEKRLHKLLQEKIE